MTKFLLAVHVLAAIVAVGPVTVAASMFPPAARRALDPPPGGPRAADAVATVELLHRICRVYAVVGVVVPVFGFATAKNMGVLGDAWLIASIVLTALAAAVLVVLVLRGRKRWYAGCCPRPPWTAPPPQRAARPTGAPEPPKPTRPPGLTEPPQPTGPPGSPGPTQPTEPPGRPESPGSPGSPPLRQPPQPPQLPQPCRVPSP